MAYNPKWNVFNRIIDSDTRIAVIDDAPNSRALVEIDGSQVADFRTGGLQLATGARVNEFSTDGTLAGVSDTAIPTEAAVKTYVDAQISGSADKIWEGDSYVEVVDDGTAAGYVTIVADGSEVARLSDATQRFGKSDDTNITISDSTTVVEAGFVEAFGISENGIYVESGVTVNDFSNDGTLADNSATALPTEYAVKTYVDAAVAGLDQTKIYEGDSYVQVVDDGTNAGYVEVVADGIQVAYWDAQATSQRFGKASSAATSNLTVTDDAVFAYVNNNTVMTLSPLAQRFGPVGDTSLIVNQSSDFIYGYIGTTQMLELLSTTATLGNPAATNIALNQSTNTATIEANNVTIFSGTDNAITLGVAADTYLSLTQDTNTVDLRAGNVSVLNATDTTQRFGASGDTALTLNTTADTFTLSAGANTHISGALNSLTLGVAGDTTIALDQSTDSITISAGNETQILVETTGVSIYEDLTVTGNLYVDGTTWVVHNQEVTTSDNIIVINNGEVGPGVTAGIAGLEIDRGTLTDYRFVFAEDTDTFRVGEIGSLQAVATREDTPESITVPWWDSVDKQFKTAGNTAITVDTTSEVIAFYASSAQVGTFESDGLTLALGTNINEFSIDGTLSGDSDNAVPTEKAVKAYVDAQIGGVSNWIYQGDSFVRVVDDTTAAGYIEIVADGIQVAYFDPNTSTQRIGKAAESRMLVADDTVTFYAGASPSVQMTLSGNGLQLATGETVNTISSSTSLGTSNTTLITQGAAMSYIDSGDSATLSSANSYADGVASAAEAAANSYTDNEISTLTSYVDAQDATTLIDAKAYADAGDAATLASANGYTDVEIAALRAELDLSNVKYVYSDTTAITGDVLLVDTTAGDVNIDLVESSDGKIVVKKITTDGNNVIISTSPGLIDGKASVTLDTGYQAYHFVSDGTNFFIL